MNDEDHNSDRRIGSLNISMPTGGSGTRETN
jgi:hypothetical protein